MWYIHKLYTIQWQYSRTLSPSDVFNTVSIESSINSWVSSYDFTLNKKYDDPLTANEYLITVEEYRDWKKDGRLIFAGTLDSIQWTLWQDENIIRYKFWWLHRLLSQIMCPMSTYSNQKVKDLVQTVVNTFNTNYPIVWSLLWWLLIKNGITDETLITKTTATTDMTCLDQLQDIMKLAWQYFFIKADGTIVWWKKPTTATHRFTAQKDITKLEVERVNVVDIVNSVIVNWTPYNDNTSISLYGKRQKIESLDTTDSTTISNFTTTYLQENAYNKREITIDVKVDDYSTIIPWNTIKILNTRLENVSNLQIQKTRYNGEIMTVYLEKYVSFFDLI